MSNELNRIVASLLANGSILVAGEEGSRKFTLASAVVEKLQDDGFTVAHIEPATTKQMLTQIAEQLGVEALQSKVQKVGYVAIAHLPIIISINT